MGGKFRIFFKYQLAICGAQSATQRHMYIMNTIHKNGSKNATAFVVSPTSSAWIINVNITVIATDIAFLRARNLAIPFSASIIGYYHEGD